MSQKQINKKIPKYINNLITNITNTEKSVESIVVKYLTG